MSEDGTISKSDKILFIINFLTEKRKDIITVEDIAVTAWKKWPDEFCMRGYPNFPNVDIQKFITRLLENALIVGGVQNYKITEKGRQYVSEKFQNNIKKSKHPNPILQVPRHVKFELARIMSTEVFKLYMKGKNDEFLESDFFEFMGTSPRSVTTKDRNIFQIRYNSLVKEVLPFCQKNKNLDARYPQILELWKILSKNYVKILQQAGVKNV